MIQRRAADAGIKTRIGNHTFRATGITAYLKNKGTLEAAQHIEQIEAPGFGHELVAIAHRSPRRPRRGGQRMISPRSLVRITVCVKWLRPTYSLKKRSRTAPIRNGPDPS